MSLVFIVTGINVERLITQDYKIFRHLIEKYMSYMYENNDNLVLFKRKIIFLYDCFDDLNTGNSGNMKKHNITRIKQQVYLNIYT